MFDDFNFLWAVIAIAALIFARRARNDVRTLRVRLDALEARLTETPPATVAQPARQALPAVANPAPVRQTETLAPAIAPIAPPAATAPPPQSATSASPAVQSPGFEERVGTRWVVWLGGLTLALGGFFMVRFSIEQGLLGPGVRTLLGGGFALALLAAGEVARRRESVSSIAVLPIANIPAILTAAGTATAFATVYAAYALYDFLVPATAFVLLGLVALGTLAAALLHGPALAGLGVAAAFVTPILVSSDAPDYWSLYIYLGIVTAAAFALARLRLWRWLAITTIAFAFLWTLPGLGTNAAPHVFHVIASFAMAAALVVSGFLFGPRATNDRVDRISSASLAAPLVGAMLIVLGSDHSDLSLTAFAVLTAATLAVCWRAPSAMSAVGIAAGLVALVFVSWAVRGNPDMLSLTGPLPGIGPNATDGSVSLHLTLAALFAVGFGIAGFGAQGRSTNALVPVIWSASAVFTPLALLIGLYARIAHLDRSIPFAILAVLLAAAFAAATEMLTRRDTRPGLPISIALFATGTLAALALALTFALDKGWLTIALALMALGTAWIANQRPIPFLRSLTAILAGIVTARIGYDPSIVGDAVGTTPIFNWLLWGYGVPTLSFWGASVLMRRRGEDKPVLVVESAAILFTVLLAFMEIRHAVNGGNIYRDDAGLLEVALQVCVALALAIGLERLRLRTKSIVHNVGAVLLTAYAGVVTIGGLLLWYSPLFSVAHVDGVVINTLLLGYALPALLALLLSYAVAGQRRAAYANTIASGALVLALSYVTLEIRRLYHGPSMYLGIIYDAEQYTYSIAYLAVGVVLLAIGVMVNSQRARLASAVVIALTVLKAFLIDMSTLTGAYRALSFMCLGLVLVAIGWLYQRILFKRSAAPPPQAADS